MWHPDTHRVLVLGLRAAHLRPASVHVALQPILITLLEVGKVSGAPAKVHTFASAQTADVTQMVKISRIYVILHSILV